MKKSSVRISIALVVPHLNHSGGIASVADFLANTIERSGRFEPRFVSIATAANDSCSLMLSRPRTWRVGATTRPGVWLGRAYTHVGAVGAELEFCRYLPRRPLKAALADCELIQVVSGSPACALSVCGLGKPVALQCATRSKVERRWLDVAASTPLTSWRRWMTRITDSMDDMALRSVDAIQVENSWMYNYVQKLNADRNVLLHYAPPGIDVDRFRPAPGRIPAARPYILFVGRMADPRKNVRLLLEAYALLPATLRDVTRLVLAGRTRPGPEFWRRAQELGLVQSIEFLEFLDAARLVSVLQCASVFALPSDEEGLGVALLEAMACGVPVVATRCGGPDGVISDGTEGFLVERNDAEAFADRLARVLGDEGLNRHMGEAARMTILQRYEATAAGDAFLRIYEELLERRRSGWCRRGAAES
jgi:D-inositol-3-phosphate glycosyltransferase